ncbi:MAG: hypothetical protein L3K18_07530 [Thermoplasmata archaeon]|nr:hypothetical protein [Thermoplasmata archaeon]
MAVSSHRLIPDVASLAEEGEVASFVPEDLAFPLRTGGSLFPARSRASASDGRLFPESPAIFPWLERAFAPGRATVLLGPARLVDGFLPFLLAAAVAEGREVSVRDGANRLAPYAIGAMSRLLGVRPTDALARVRLARAFTAYQLVTLMESWAESVGVRDPPPSLLVVNDPTRMFYVDDVPPEEGEALLAHVSGCLGRLVRSSRVPLLLTAVDSPGDIPGWDRSGPEVREHLRLVPMGRGVARLEALRQGRSVELISLPSRQHRLESFDEPAVVGAEGRAWDGPFPPIGTL